MISLFFERDYPGKNDDAIFPFAFHIAVQQPLIGSMLHKITVVWNQRFYSRYNKEKMSKLSFKQFL